MYHEEEQSLFNWTKGIKWAGVNIVTLHSESKAFGCVNLPNEHPSPKVTHLILPLIGGYSKCKLFYSGHSHSYERFRVGARHYVVTGGGGAPLDLTERAVFPADLYEGGPIRGFHYCLMTLYKKGCSIEMFELQSDGSWMVRDSMELTYEKSNAKK